MKQYLELLKEIVEDGVVKPNRTGVDTIGIFGSRIKMNLRDGFPILTTKKMFMRGIIEELLFFLRGDTDTNKLSEKGVKIWEANTTREFLDNKGLDYPAGEMGPGYGFQWRNFGGTYKDAPNIQFDPMSTDAKARGPWSEDPRDTGIYKLNDGVDQIAQVVETLKKNPNDRRMLVSAWNPLQVPDTALPPCHLLYQFYVDNHKRLSCQFYMRSIDVPLGLPFNIASYAFLTHIIAAVTGHDVGNLIFVGGDTHIYVNQMDGVNEQLDREPLELPEFFWHQKPESLHDITELSPADFGMEGYISHPRINFPFAT